MTASKERIEEVIDLYNELEDKKSVASQMGLATSTIKRYIRRARDLGILEEEYKNNFAKNKVEVKHEGNEAIATSKSERIKTLDQLIRQTNIDLDKWEVDKHTVNKWEGQKEGGEPVELYQVKAWLTRKVLTKKEFEPVKPISLDYQYDKPAEPYEAGTKKAVIIPDVHIGYRRDTYTKEMTPFHDRRCLELDIQLIEDIQPDEIIILGDFLDMPNWNKKFIRSPEFANTFQDSINEGHKWLKRFRDSALDAKIIYLQGNHEERARRFLARSNKAAYGIKQATATEDDPDLVSIPNILDLPSLQIEWIGNYPDGGYWINDNLVTEHGSRVSSVNGKSAGQILDDARESHLFGHTHRLEMATKTTYPKNGPKMYQSVSLGCQCKIGGKTPGTKEKQDWQNAVGIVEYKEGNDEFYINPIFINEGSMIYNGKKYSSS